MKTALIMIATGERYHNYIDIIIQSAKRYFVPHDSILWTDWTEDTDATYQFKKAAFGYPKETLYRYHTFLQRKTLLQNYDQLFYCDIDMEFVLPVTESDIFSKGITATLHPGYLGRSGTPERRLESSAYIPHGSPSKYFCGGFIGGAAQTFLTMAENIRRNINIDDTNNIMAVWHDESHLNRYLYAYPPARILTPSFCYPEHYIDKGVQDLKEYTPVLLALDKNKVRR